MLAPFTQRPWEKLVEDTFLESLCAFRGRSEYQFVHPDDAARRASLAGFRWVRLRRTCPLALNDPGRWISFSPETA